MLKYILVNALKINKNWDLLLLNYFNKKITNREFDLM